MRDKKKFVKNIASVVGSVLLLSFMVAEIIASNTFSTWLTSFFGGRGTSFDNNFSTVAQSSDDIVRQIEDEGIVLLKNDNQTLPISKAKKVNVFGWGSTNEGFMLSGSGSGSSIERGGGVIEPVYLLEGLKKAGFETNSELTKLYTNFCHKKQGKRQSLDDSQDVFFKLYEPNADYYSDELMNRCLNFSDVAIIVITRVGGEGLDLPPYQYKFKYQTDKTRNYLQISTEEEALIDRVTNAGFNKVICLINTTNAMEMGFLNNDKINAALLVGGPGQTGTIEIGRVLKGEVNPSGRTADTYTYDNSTYSPSYMHRKGNGINIYSNYNYQGTETAYIDYREGIYVGYKWYETADQMKYFAAVENEYGEGYEGVVQYPFGYGLSYTDFVWKVNSISPNPGSVINSLDTITVTLTVTNTGTYAGKDVVELYYSSPYTKGGIEKASINLGAFAKTSLLKPNQKETLTLSIPVRDMKSYDYNDANNNGFKGYELESGVYSISLRYNAHEIASISKATAKYQINDNELLSHDEITNQEISNRFTGENAYADTSIDGSNTDANITWLSRKAFKSTFPKKRSTRAKSQNLLDLADNWFNDDNNYEMPVTNENNGLYLFVDDGEGKQVFNHDLLYKLGGDYNSSNWDKLLNQLTVNELITLVEMGGFKTSAVDSIKKPECIDLDGPTGLNNSIASIASSPWTSYPIETTLASTWNVELAYLFGQSVANEANSTNVSGWYAPGANIHRDPFGGRNFEYFSEDSFLSGKFAANEAKGALENGLYVYMKHFICYENASGMLYSWLTEQTLREIYLRPFEIAIKEGGVNALMSSFGRVGAVWSGGNKALLEDVTRGEWGFKGSIITDWSSGGTYMNVDQGLYAGNDLWLSGAQIAPSGHDDKHSSRGVSYMRKAAKNILYTYCNTYYRSYEDGHTMQIKKAQEVFPVWVIYVAIIITIEAFGLMFIMYFLLLRNNVIKFNIFKRKKKNENK